MFSPTITKNLKNINSSSNDAETTKDRSNHMQNSIGQNGGLASRAHPKYNNADPESWLRTTKLEFMDQLHDLFTAIIEEKTTAFCTASKHPNGALYIDCVGSRETLKIYPGDKARVLNRLWENCPVYTEDCSPYDWYPQQKSAREQPARSNPQPRPVPTVRETQADEFVDEVERAFATIDSSRSLDWES
jgi:hypothetical protein